MELFRSKVDEDAGFQQTEAPDGDADGEWKQPAAFRKLPDGTLVPKGSKLKGHRHCFKSARSKGDTDSQLTVAFDKLNILVTKWQDALH